MSAQIINLRATKKAKEKSLARAQADANAAKFGRTKAKKAAEKSTADRANRTLDGHALDDKT
ncbi:DUF4169 family protein [Pseudorhodobacter antarcticus]|uniref:DUF4169 family protein n=1 Tax=Pseudorhodobacter antarcticus TaxID=1077947 RepID=UPI00067D7CE1|nr:DUF4169 family protein [Pseudorhodobacter antarcticus]